MSMQGQRDLAGLCSSLLQHKPRAALKGTKIQKILGDRRVLC